MTRRWYQTQPQPWIERERLADYARMVKVYQSTISDLHVLVQKHGKEIEHQYLNTPPLSATYDWHNIGTWIDLKW